MTGYIPYILLSLWPVVLTAPFPKYIKDQKQRRRLLILAGVVLFLFIGLRSYTLGSTDSLHYYARMERAIASADWYSFYDPNGVEAGFQLFVWLLSRVCWDPQGLFFATGLIYVACVLYLIDRESHDPVLSIVFFVTLGLFTFELQGMRQALAMSLCYLAFVEAVKGKLWRFIFIVVLAMQFHQTAVVFLIVYPICRMNFSLKYGFVILAMSVVLVGFSGQIVGLGNSYFDRAYSTAFSSGGYVMVAIYVAAVWFPLLFYKETRNARGQTALLYLCIVNLATYLMRYTGVATAERISFYFAFAVILMFANCISGFNGADKKQRFALAFLATALSIGLFVYRLNGSGLVPYLFFF